MSPMLLQAVVRVADARTPDADLLDRFVRHRDERAFEELVRRHGALVWAVCRRFRRITPMPRTPSKRSFSPSFGARPDLWRVRRCHPGFMVSRCASPSRPGAAPFGGGMRGMRRAARGQSTRARLIVGRS